MSLANDAITYINAHGVGDINFVSYFGNVQDATTQLGVYQVCARYLDSSAFLRAHRFNSERGLIIHTHLELHRP
jgi:hypothetical protein